MKKIIEYFAQRSLIVNIITLGIFISGLMFVLTANREAFPRIEYDWIIVTTIYPGSTAADIEKHISIPIENEMRGVEGIDEVYSGSHESRSVLAIKLDADLKDKSKVINNIKDAVDSVEDFPADAEDPVVTELSTSLVPVIEISIVDKNGVKNDFQERELRHRAKIMEDMLLDLGGVAQIDKKGYRDREMTVEISPRKMEIYHVSVNDIISALSKKNLNFPGGTAKTEKEDIMIRTIGEVENSKEIENVLVNANDLGNWVTVGDVAKVRDSFKEEDLIIQTFGMKSITLTVLKKESADIIDLVEDVKKVNEKLQKQFGSRYEITLSNDLSYYVKRRLNVLINNGIVGFCLVLICLFLSLGWRIASVTAIGLPIAFCITFMWMAYAGVTVNLMSMFGMIVVLGMLVDDAIVVSENIYRHIEEGEPIKEAVINGTSEVFLPVAGTILTTIAAFSPLMFMSGIMGKFMWTLPAVVSVALVASWIESMFILPSHVYDIERMNKNISNEKRIEGGKFHRFFTQKYGNLLSLVLRNKYKSLALITIFFLGTVFFAASNMKVVLFPQDKIERFVIKLEASNGTSLEKMNHKVSLIEKIVGNLPEEELDNYISMTGIIREAAMDPGEKRGSNYGTILVNLTPEEQRKRKASTIIEDVRNLAKVYSNEFVKVEMNPRKNGPPVGAAVDVKIRGEDFKDLREIATLFKDYLKTIPGLKDVKDDFEQGKTELRVIVDEKTAAVAGISVYDVASTVRSCFEGTVATKIKKSDEEIDIRVKFPENLRNNLRSLRYVKIPNRLGNLIPLNSVAKFEEGKGISVINRQNWKRTVSVTAEIDDKAKDLSSVSVNRMLQEKFSEIDLNYPGVIVDYLGEFKDTKDSMEDLIISFVIAIFVIYFILVGLFGSLIHPIVIVSVIPMTVIGVIWTFYLHGMPFSFLGIMGVVGLAGVVVNDSIVFVDFIKRNRGRGMSAFEASVDAGLKRLRPVYLTTVTTFFGLIPTAYGIGGYDPFLKPMAVSLSWGLLFGTFITLFGTPLVYNVFTDLRRLITRKEQSSEVFREHDSVFTSEIKQAVPEEMKATIIEEMNIFLKEKVDSDLDERIDKIVKEKISKIKINSKGKEK